MSDLIRREDAINAMAELQGIAQSKAELTGISKAWKKIKALPAASLWHRVEERLPKPGEYVLAWERQGFCVVDRYIDIDDGRWGLSNDGAIYTHWMPLPEPPKEG